MRCRYWILFGGLCLVVIGSGCSESYTMDPDAGDAGERKPNERKEIEPRTPTCTPDREARCGCVGDYSRCDTCDGDCGLGPFQCINDGICVHTQDDKMSMCSFSEDEGKTAFRRLCPNGMQCLLDRSADLSYGPGPGFVGWCWPLEFCIALEESDSFDSAHGCYFFDGSIVNTRPEAAPPECPDADPWAPFCGGPCGEFLGCPGAAGEPFFGGDPGPCVGISADRAMGFCGATLRQCQRGYAEINRELIEFCELGLKSKCACVDLVSENPEHDGYGYVTLLSTCERYAALYPGQVRCLDAEWEQISP